MERRVETSLSSPVDIIDGLGLGGGGISRNDQNQKKEVKQIQYTHAIDFKGSSDYNS